eukprot:CAMPEP_0168609910 /NCGR_PEP_ID=MMETSP0449_2-20121227/1480_1 /TAXON_ID=1082188 /ORGANISM="Strombidium rassoulzadegani, Strain ras09" /LENGTH=71 /DNA_ID=CAMNT_0008650129 /DNA_START=265 /DNA_END=480 /DNA_ORIENTATION=+
MRKKLEKYVESYTNRKVVGFFDEYQRLLEKLVHRVLMIYVNELMYIDDQNLDENGKPRIAKFELSDEEFAD